MVKAIGSRRATSPPKTYQPLEVEKPWGQVYSVYFEYSPPQ